MYKYLYILILTVLCGMSAYAQQNKADEKVSKLPWATIKESDILWKKRVWRRIDIREYANAALSNNPQTAIENTFANLLLKGLQSGELKAYTRSDTAFLNPLTNSQLDSALTCDTPASCKYPDQVKYYGIVEDWMFDKEQGRMVVHILAIAPMKVIDGKETPLFWLNYLAVMDLIGDKHLLTGAKKQDMTWTQFFETRQFASLITKVSPSDHVPDPPRRHKHRDRKEE